MGVKKRKNVIASAIFAFALVVCLAGCITSPKPAQNKAAAANADPASRFGIAIQSSGRVCLSIANPNLSSGASIKLIFPGNPQSTADAAVIGSSHTCPDLEEDHSTSYDLRISAGHVEDNAEQIAVAGPATFSVGNGGAVVGQLDPRTKALTFRSCESSEGVHMTVWSGAPLTGDRIWHAYHHLDYGVEPNCTEKDTAP
jgi:hypothetical protein